MVMRYLLALLAAVLLIGGGYFYTQNYDYLPALKDAVSKPKAAQKTFNASEFFLENGMQIVVIPNHRAPVVTHMVWYKAGAADEPRGKSGIAHFLEHLLFKGSDVIGGEPLPPGEFSKIIRGLGGNDNAFTSQDYTAYFQSIPVQHLERVMRMEAGRMRGASFPEDEVLAENKVILEERRQRTDNDPRAQFGEHVAAAAFINHPYGTPVIGWYHEMEKLSRADVLDFYNRWYAPDNAILIVSGDVEPQAVYDLAAATYGTIPKQNVPDRMRVKSPPFPSTAHVTLEHERVREPAVQILIRAPGYAQDKDASLALQLLEEILSGGPSARLYKSLVSEQKIAVSAGMSYRSNAIDGGQVWLYATPVPGMDLDDLQDSLKVEVQKIVEAGVTADELSRAKVSLQNAAIYARDSLTGPAMIVGRALTTGASVDDVETWPAQLEAVTAEQVADAAHRILNPAHLPVTGYLIPQADFEEIKDE